MPRLACVKLMVGICAAAALVPSESGAQRRDSLPVAVGTTVRVILLERPVVRFVGPLAGQDSLRVLVSDRRAMSIVNIEWTAIETIEVRRPALTSSAAFGRGARVGAIVFGTVGLAATVAGVTWDLRGGCRESDNEYCWPGSLIVIPAYLLTVGGTVLGGVTGLMFRDRWHTVWRNH